MITFYVGSWHKLAELPAVLSLYCYWFLDGCTVSGISLFSWLPTGYQIIDRKTRKEGNNQSNTGVSNDIRGCLLFKRALVISKWLDYPNMSPCHAGQVNLTIDWAFGKLFSWSQSSFNFGCRKSMLWEIRCLEQFLISEDGLFVVVKLFPNVRKNTIFLTFQIKYLKLVYSFTHKRWYFLLALRKLQLFCYFFSQNKRKNGHIETSLGVHTGHLELACSL